MLASGQAHLRLNARPGGRRAAATTYWTPHGRASLRVSGEGTCPTLWVNGRRVDLDDVALPRDHDRVIDLSPHTRRGTNALEGALDDGTALCLVEHPRLVDASPEDVGVDPSILAAMTRALERATGLDGDASCPGAVVLVAHRGHVIHERALGWAHALELSGGRVRTVQTPRAMTPETVFDLASITKVVATTAALMRLVDERRVELDDTIEQHLPGLLAAGERITVRHLLTHRSGLPPWAPTWLHASGPEEAARYVGSLALDREPGTARAYSDLGFMVLRPLIEAVTGRGLTDYLSATVHRPLGMSATRFRPARAHGPFAATSHGNPYERAMLDHGWPYPVGQDEVPAAFEGWRSHTLVGEANDANAWHAWHGTAGHAGLFSTARDLARFAQTMINGGGYGGSTLVSRDTVTRFLRPSADAGQAHGFLSQRLGDGGHGHSGFTGTELAFDVERELALVLLTNRLHARQGPEGDAAPWDLYPSVKPLWGALVAQANRIGS